MKSNNFPDKEMLDMPPDLEGITRPKKKAKTKLFKLRIRGIGNAALVLQTYAETEKDAIKYVKNRWADCKVEVLKWKELI